MNNKLYKLIKIQRNSHDIFAVILLSNSDVSEILKELKEKGELGNLNGQLYIDLFFRAGNSSQRFFKVDVENGSLNSNSAQFVLLDKNNHIRKEANKFLRNQDLRFSIANKFQKSLIKKGVNI